MQLQHKFELFKLTDKKTAFLLLTKHPTQKKEEISRVCLWVKMSHKVEIIILTVCVKWVDTSLWLLSIRAIVM